VEERRKNGERLAPGVKDCCANQKQILFCFLYLFFILFLMEVFL